MFIIFLLKWKFLNSFCRDVDGVAVLVQDEESCVVMVTKNRDQLHVVLKVVKLLFTNVCLKLDFITIRKFFCFSYFGSRWILILDINFFVSGRDLQIVNLSTIQQFIDQGRLIPKKDGFTTIRDLKNAGLFLTANDGVKILADVR